MNQSLLKLAIVTVLAAAGTTYAITGSAATATSDLGVSATVSANCTISTAPVAFGSYDPVSAHASTALESTGTVTVKCTSGASTTVTLGQGANANTGSTDAEPVRRMISGANYLSYALYSDDGRSVTWGNTELTGVSHTGTGVDVALTVYGSVAGGQNVPAGSYSDTVVATVTF